MNIAYIHQALDIIEFSLFIVIKEAAIYYYIIIIIICI